MFATSSSYQPPAPWRTASVTPITKPCCQPGSSTIARSAAGRRRHDRPEGGQRIAQQVGPDLLGQPPHLVEVAHVEQSLLERVEVDLLLRLGRIHRCAADHDRHRRDPIGVAGRDGQDVRARPARPVDRQPLDAELVEDRDRVVGVLGEAATLEPGRGAEAGALGRDDAQPALDPGRPIGPQREPRAGRAGHAQDRPAAGHAGLAPGDDAAVGSGQAMVGDVAARSRSWLVGDHRPSITRCCR